MTGSRGYIGTILCPNLIDNGYEVVEFDKVIGDDILSKEALKVKAEDVDVIIHMAGVVGMKAVDDNPIMARNVHLIGTDNVLACGKKVIFTSVLGAYNNVKLVTEDVPVAPKHEYFTQKLHSENMVRRNYKNVVLRFGTLYGVSPMMRDDLLVHTLTREAVGGSIKIFQPDVMRPITNVRDAVSALIFFATSKNSGGLYNIVSRNCTKRSIAEIAAKVNNAELDVVDEVDSENRNYMVSTERVQMLGFSFSDDLVNSISEISKHYSQVLNKV